MHMIYIDEAGIGGNEPVTICASVIIDGDAQWKAAHREIERIFDAHVPKKWREGFVFHATDIWNSKKYRDGWDRASRLRLIRKMMAIPRKLKLAVSVGVCRRSSSIPADLEGHIAKEAFDHFMAFHYCLTKADQYVRAARRADEISVVIAEDSPKMKKLLKATLEIPPVSMNAEHLNPTRREILLNEGPSVHTFRVETVVDEIHFVDGNKAPMLQLADACAFGFRRYLSKQEYGDLMTYAILGVGLHEEDWRGPSSGVLYAFNQRQIKGA